MIDRQSGSPAPLVLCCLVWALSGCGGEAAPEARSPGSAHAHKKRASHTKSLTPEQLRKVMNGKSMALAGCYEVSESKNRSEAGDLTVEFEVSTNGGVSGERVTDSSLRDDVLNDCVLGVVKKARFPSATAPTDVTWPVRFRSRQ